MYGVCMVRFWQSCGNRCMRGCCSYSVGFIPHIFSDKQAMGVRVHYLPCRMTLNQRESLGHCYYIIYMSC